MARVEQIAMLENEAPRARVIRLLKGWIDQGVLRKGEPLPSERSLSKKLGASQATIQRALRILESEGLVSELAGRTRLVQEAAPRASASVWAKSIVIIAPVSEPIRGHIQPGWFEYITLGAIAAARQTGQHVLTLDPKRIRGEWESGSLESTAYGVIVATERELRREIQPVIDAFVESGTPIVVYGDSPENAPFDRVSSDHVHGCKELTRWLIQQGRTRILPVWSVGKGGVESIPYWLNQRRQGYEQAMREAGLESLTPLWVPSPEGQTSDKTVFQTYLHTLAGFLVPYLTGTRGVDALLAISDGEVRVLGSACRLFGCTPGSDVLIGGYDHYAADTLERAFEPAGPAVTVDKLNWRMGQEMLTLLADRIEKRLPAEPQCRLIKPELVVLS